MWKLSLILFHIITVIAVPAQKLNTHTEQLEGRTLYLAWYGDAPTAETPVIMALHGSGRSALSYSSESPEGVTFYIHQRDLALKAGYLFVSVSNGPDTWGTDEGIKAIRNTIQFVKNRFPVRDKWVFWASSAGGVLLGRILNEYPDLVDRALGTFPVYNLSDSYDRLNSARAAFKDTDKIVQINPANTPQAFARVPYLVFHGTNDEAVPLNIHSEQMAKEANALGGNVRLIKVEGGHSTENHALYDDDMILDFLENR